jgi:hypothetical protein
MPDVLPPSIGIFDTQAHHEIAGMLSDVESLQQEPERTDLKRCNLLVAPIDRESRIGIELLGEFGVFGGQECLEIGRGTRMHFGFPHTKCCELAKILRRHVQTVVIRRQLHWPAQRSMREMAIFYQQCITA